MPENTRSNRSLTRHTGADALLKFEAGDGYKEIPVSNTSWTKEYSTNDPQHSGSLKPTMTTTGIRYSGSFEYDGQNPNALDAISVRQEDGVVEQDRPARGTLTIQEYNHDNNDDKVLTVTFVRVLVTNVNRDLPADGSSSTSVDWSAEDMIQTNRTA